MTALFVKIFAERNCGASRFGRDVKRTWAATVLRGAPEMDRAALRHVLKSVTPRERSALHNHMLDMEHDRILYSDFGWSASAPSPDIIQSAAHAAETLFVGVTMHPVAFAAALNEKPRTPGAPNKPVSLQTWLMQPFPVHRRDNLPEQRPLEPMAIWSAKMRALLNLAETDRKVVFVKAGEVRETAQDILNPHLMRKEGSAPEFSKIEIPEWEATLRRVPARVLRELRMQLDSGVLHALGYEQL